MSFLEYEIYSIKKLLMKSVLWVLKHTVARVPVSSWNTFEESEAFKFKFQTEQTEFPRYQVKSSG